MLLTGKKYQLTQLMNQVKHPEANVIYSCNIQSNKTCTVPRKMSCHNLQGSYTQHFHYIFNLFRFHLHTAGLHFTVQRGSTDMSCTLCCIEFKGEQYLIPGGKKKTVLAKMNSHSLCQLSLFFPLQCQPTRKLYIITKNKMK